MMPVAFTGDVDVRLPVVVGDGSPDNGDEVGVVPGVVGGGVVPGCAVVGGCPVGVAGLFDVTGGGAGGVGFVVGGKVRAG